MGSILQADNNHEDDDDDEAMEHKCVAPHATYTPV